MSKIDFQRPAQKRDAIFISFVNMKISKNGIKYNQFGIIKILKRRFKPMFTILNKWKKTLLTHLKK